MATRRSEAVLSGEEVDRFVWALNQMKSPDSETGGLEYEPSSKVAAIKIRI